MTSLEIEKIEAILGYSFRDEELLSKALTHSSYANEVCGDALMGNERLEFLGDAVLDLVVSDILYRKFPDEKEGVLTKLRASLVREKTLFGAAVVSGLNKHFRLGRGEEAGGGRRKPSIAADALEAVLGAIYLDGGLDAAAAVAERLLKEMVPDISLIRSAGDFKSELQERIQASGGSGPTYSIVGEEGPEHDKVFTAAVHIAGAKVAVGKGRSKKEAEQSAAEEALRSFNKAGEEEME